MKNKLVTTVMTMGFRRRSIRNLLRPSVSAYVIINLDETVITEVIEDLIIDGLVERNKQFMKSLSWAWIENIIINLRVFIVEAEQLWDF